MTTLDLIRNHHQMARKARDTVISNLLGLIISECETEAHGSKGKGSHVLAENDIIAIVQNTAKKINETMTLIQSHPERHEEYVKLQYEATALAAYLPTQLSIEGLRQAVLGQVELGENMGEIMQYLKTEYPGRYDAKEASVIVKDILAEATKQ